MIEHGAQAAGKPASALGFFAKERIVAGPGFNRWLIVPAALGIHLCIGSVYAWSILNPALVRNVGVVASAADDWTLANVVWVFTVAIVCLGLSAAFAGKWLERVGPRTVGMLSAILWSSGFVVGGLAIFTRQLWLLYLGYGVIGGCGLGLGYISPVSTLIRWFPDRRGMATGLAIMGFGGGAMLGAPLKALLIDFYFRAPTYLGPVADVSLVTEAGRRFASVGGELREVVTVGAQDLAGLPVGLAEGVYLVGTGTSGVAETFLTLGLVYLAVMAAAALAYRLPESGWHPPGWDVHAAVRVMGPMTTYHHVHIDQALKTPQFYQLWVMLCFNVTAGLGVLGVAKTMMTDLFGTTLPNVVDGAFAAFYVVMISVFNMAGRLLWASASDYLGRRNTYWIFFALGVVLYCSIPWIAWQASIDPRVVWLVVFYAATLLIFTLYGGGFATIPAYLSDVFGTRYVGGIHGRLLTAWSVAGVLGPTAITSLRESAVRRAIDDLVARIDPAAFHAAFGADVDHLAALVEAKTVTIAKLMAIVPPGVADPTPNLYDGTMYLMALLLAIALVCNALMQPVNERHHMLGSSD